MSAIYTSYSVKISCIYYLLLGLYSTYDPSTKNIEDFKPVINIILRHISTLSPMSCRSEQIEAITACHGPGRCGVKIGQSEASLPEGASK